MPKYPSFKFGQNIKLQQSVHKTQTYDVYSDPGHGWVKVPKRTLDELGIEDQITPFSYQRGKYAYLEEDQDLTTFVEAQRNRGIEVTYREHISNKQSKIRSYREYEP